MNKKVYITDYIDNPDVEQTVLGDFLTDQLNEDVEVLLVWHEVIDAAYMERLPRLRAVVRYGVGYDNIDLERATKNGIFVCTTPDYGVDEVSDTAISMMLSFTRGVIAYDHLAKGLTGGTWQENVISDIRRSNEQTVGVVGAGRIGTSVLIKARALGFRTAFFDPYVVRGHEKVCRATRHETLAGLLNNVDIVSVHVPLNGETESMINQRFIENMKDGGILINTARGRLLHSLALIESALDSKKLRAVGLDVLPDEPPREESLIARWRSSDGTLQGRLLINPHTSYFSREAYREMRQKAAENALKVMKGERPWSIICGPEK